MTNFNFLDVNKAVAKFPENADTMLVDCYLSDSPECSSRVFRLYSHLPKHYHKQCSEHLYLLKGKVKFYIEDEEPRELHPGQMVTFYKNVVHGIESVGDEPTVILSFDTPRREPSDVHFVNPEETKGIEFVRQIEID